MAVVSLAVEKWRKGRLECAALTDFPLSIKTPLIYNKILRWKWNRTPPTSCKINTETLNCLILLCNPLSFVSAMVERGNEGWFLCNESLRLIDNFGVLWKQYLILLECRGRAALWKFVIIYYIRNCVMKTISTYYTSNIFYF